MTSIWRATSTVSRSMTGGRPTSAFRAAAVSKMQPALGWQPAPAQMPLPLHGYAAGATPARESCIGDQKAGTDVLIVRGVDPAAITVAAAAADSHLNDYFLQTSACANPAIDPADRSFVVASGGGGAPAAFTLHQTDCVTPALLRRLVVRAYYVGKCSVCTGSGDGFTRCGWWSWRG
ncbi:MAG: hypothetical protein IPI73_12500 [Betaproteobacteria bacterium]|nr:hypothetical protein [Betaproteobacteria bacterium]